MPGETVSPERQQERDVYQSIAIDAGQICRNLYLATGSIDWGACAIESFRDDYMNLLLGIDRRSQFLIYYAAVGKIPQGL